MKNRLLAAALTGTCVIAAASGAAVAARSHAAAVPARVTIKQKQTLVMKPNRYVKDTMRFNRDVYRVKSGGTLHLVDSVVTEGPHTVTVVKKADRPRNAAQMNECAICQKLAAARLLRSPHRLRASHALGPPAAHPRRCHEPEVRAITFSRRLGVGALWSCRLSVQVAGAGWSS